MTTTTAERHVALTPMLPLAFYAIAACLLQCEGVESNQIAKALSTAADNVAPFLTPEAIVDPAQDLHDAVWEVIEAHPETEHDVAALMAYAKTREDSITIDGAIMSTRGSAMRIGVQHGLVAGYLLAQMLAATAAEGASKPTVTPQSTPSERL